LNFPIGNGTVTILINDTLGLLTGIPILSGPGVAVLSLPRALPFARAHRVGAGYPPSRRTRPFFHAAS